MCCWRKKSRGFTWRGGNTLPGKHSFSFPFFCTTHVLITSHEIKRRLLLGRKVMTNLDSIFKSRDITLPTKVRLVKAIVFPIVMYGCEGWTIKKAEHFVEELKLLNCGVGEDSWESLGLQGDPTSPFWREPLWRKPCRCCGFQADFRVRTPWIGRRWKKRWVLLAGGKKKS